MFTRLLFTCLVKPGQSYYLDQIDPFAGFRHPFTTFGAFLDPIPLLPEIFGLFLVGGGVELRPYTNG